MVVSDSVTYIEATNLYQIKETIALKILTSHILAKGLIDEFQIRWKLTFWDAQNRVVFD